MDPNQLPESVREILALLSNVDDLIRVSNLRKMASDVLRAATVYADQKEVALPIQKVNSFYAVAGDSRACTLSALIHDIARDVIELSVKASRRPSAV